VRNTVSGLKMIISGHVFTSTKIQDLLAIKVQLAVPRTAYRVREPSEPSEPSRAERVRIPVQIPVLYSILSNKLLHLSHF
jgi:hypothetical protein